MIVKEQIYQHPTQASQVRLVAYQTAANTSQVEGMPDDAGYLATEEWRERAGGYAIQGRGASMIASVDGSFTNVIGLPLDEVGAVLGEAGLLAR